MQAVLVAMALLPIACSSVPGPPSNAIELSDEVFVQPIAPGVWRHVSYRWFPAGPFPSNGLVVQTPTGALLVDTAWNSEQTKQVLEWASHAVGPVSAVVITHAHDDRLGGIEVVHERGIDSVALAKTAELARKAGWPSPTRVVRSGFSLAAYGVSGELFFPGEAHTADNAVVYFEQQAVLAGSCMVRSLEATSLGNLADAAPNAWPASVRAVLTRFPEVRVVVPGHGRPGDRQLLDHTLRLLAQSRQ